MPVTVLVTTLPLTVTTCTLVTGVGVHDVMVEAVVLGASVVVGVLPVFFDDDIPEVRVDAADDDGITEASLEVLTMALLVTEAVPWVPEGFLSNAT